jgi:hypothetical protein
MNPKRNFETPEDLEKAWESFKKYKIEDAKNWPKVQYVGKEGKRVEDYPVLPLTKSGFELWCYKIYGHVSQYFDNKDGLYKEYVAICSHITLECREQQITGGMLGMFNTSITQRLNGLKDEQTIEVKNEPRVFIRK